MLPEKPKRRRKVLSEINVTPFVDIMLVLLIIFMVTAPFLEHGIDIELPETQQKSEKGQRKESLRIEVRKDKSILIHSKKIQLDDIHQKLTQIHTQLAGAHTNVLIYADKDLPYGFVTQLMALIQDVGFTQLSLVTQPLSKNER